jgi:hypothetical protein
LETAAVGLDCLDKVQMALLEQHFIVVHVTKQLAVVVEAGEQPPQLQHGVVLVQSI